mmetsp:Transcript_40297/g.92663  ORF Transcript_40297/g.92663 Transcript_40297/m.92663 type:complete len:678 (-) Transcript_40297:56-2089(-)
MLAEDAGVGEPASAMDMDLATEWQSLTSCRAEVASPGRGAHLQADAGEGMMQDFVRWHMVSILQPFAEKVQDLAMEVSRVGAWVHRMDGAAEGHDGRLAAIEGLNLEQLQKQTDERIEELAKKVQHDITSVRKEHNRLEGNHEITKANVTKAKESVQDVDRQMQEMKNTIAETVSKISSVELAIADTEKRLEGQLEVRLNKQGKACKELGEKQIELMKNCEQSRTMAEKAGGALKKLATVQEMQGQQHTSGLSALSSRIEALDGKLGATNNELHACVNTVRASEQELQSLKPTLVRVSEVDALAKKQMEAVAAAESQLRRVQKLEVDVSQIMADNSTERQLQETVLSGLEQKVSKCLLDGAKWCESHRAQSDLLHAACRRVEGVEESNNRLLAQIESSQTELRGLVTWHRVASTNLDSQRSSIDDLRENLSKAQEAAHTSSATLQTLRDEMSMQRDALGKVGARVDQCYKFFNGFGKGLQDTSRLLAPQQPPMPKHEAQLPDLPRDISVSTAPPVHIEPSRGGAGMSHTAQIDQIRSVSHGPPHMQAEPSRSTTPIDTARRADPPYNQTESTRSAALIDSARRADNDKRTEPSTPRFHHGGASAPHPCMAPPSIPAAMLPVIAQQLQSTYGHPKTPRGLGGGPPTPMQHGSCTAMRGPGAPSGCATPRRSKTGHGRH